MEHATIEVDSTRVVWLPDGSRSGTAVSAAAAAAALGAPTNGSAVGLSTAMSTAPPGRRASGPGTSTLWRVAEVSFGLCSMELLVPFTCTSGRGHHPGNATCRD